MKSIKIRVRRKATLATVKFLLLVNLTRAIARFGERASDTKVKLLVEAKDRSKRLLFRGEARRGEARNG